MKRIYLAGPMTGTPDNNYPGFAEAAARLRAFGYTVVSPHELHGGDTNREWIWYLRRDLRAMLDCDTIVMLRGWRNSRGAVLERHVAAETGMRIREIADLYAELRTIERRTTQRINVPAVRIGDTR